MPRVVVAGFSWTFKRKINRRSALRIRRTDVLIFLLILACLLAVLGGMAIADSEPVGIFLIIGAILIAVSAPWAVNSDQSGYNSFLNDCHYKHHGIVVQHANKDLCVNPNDVIDTR